MTSISLINIGSELLNGRIVNTNATRIGQMLQEAGFLLGRIVVIPDDPALIRQAVEEAWSQHDVVLISGGLGPTKDDMTKHVLATWWGTPLVEHAPTLAFLYRRYEERGRQMNELTKAQAMAPDGAEVIPNPVGTAPGLGFFRDRRWLVAMPGVPFELFQMMEEQIIPRLCAQYPGLQYLKTVLRLRNVSESEIAIQLLDIEDALPPHFSLAYLPRTDGLWLELKAIASVETEVATRELLQTIAAQMHDRLRVHVYATNDAPLPQLLGEVLQAQEATLAVAESLTGGALASRIVSVSGSSRYFLGSVTAYSPEVKIAMLRVSPAIIKAHTVVSPEVAIAMAEGVKSLLGSVFAISTTGWAEAPDPRTPVGAWIGFAGLGASEAHWVSMSHPRAVVIERVVEQALALALEKVRNATG